MIQTQSAALLLGSGVGVWGLGRGETGVRDREQERESHLQGSRSQAKGFLHGLRQIKQCVTNQQCLSKT